MRTLRLLAVGALVALLASCSSNATGNPSAAGSTAVSTSGGTGLAAPGSTAAGMAGATSPGLPGVATQPAISASATAPGQATGTSGSKTGPPTGTTSAPTHFATLAPGAKLPTDAQCAAWVRARPMAENKGSNKTPNHTTGQHVAGSLFAGDTAKATSAIAPRIDGNFTGTTQEILRWVACKWGIDENIVFAQAAVESWWRQDTLGDWDSDATACPPGHGLGADGKAGRCPQSYGILQDRWPYMKQGWPGFGRSTAMDADMAYGIWRSCYDGYETWLNTVDRGQQYRSGDAWGCVGRWFSGRWHTSASDGYVTKVKQYESQQIWKTRDFQQP
jgi:autotransporter family porin